ncbi:MAG: adenylate/guanylate cyclase domain-containing protein [Acidobacteriota bacterium]|nr:adenylate/guanylate cyclase domain-containing protein [Acidobacteriota bacterium]
MELNHNVMRRSAKHVFLDVVQFSKRSAEAQSDIVQYLNEIVRHTLGNHNVNLEEDCILIPTGDGMCISLIGSNLPFDIHIQTALGILEALDKHNRETENQTRSFQIRIGINQNTDILVTDINNKKNIAGSGINKAARIMDKADGGQILVSETVFEELSSSETYSDKFKRFSATVKHNISFPVHQYIGDNHMGLNKETPSAWVKSEPEKKKLSQDAAYYLVQAVIHKQDLMRIKADERVFFENTAVHLLNLLAVDLHAQLNASEFENKPDLHTYGAGKKGFDEQFDYYNSQDYWVMVEGGKAISALKLSPYSECFEYGDFRYHYAFVSKKGIERLKEERFDLWEKFELDKFV